MKTNLPGKEITPPFYKSTNAKILLNICSKLPNANIRVHVEQYPLMSRSATMAAAKLEALVAAEKLVLVATTSWWQTGTDNNQLNAARAIWRLQR